MPEPTTTSLARPQSAVAEPVSSRVPASPPLPVKAGKEQIVWAVLRGVGRRWKQVVGVGLLAASAAAVSIWFFLPPSTPSAAAKLYMPQKPPTALGGEHPDPPLERQTQAELIKSRLVLNAAI